MGIGSHTEQIQQIRLQAGKLNQWLPALLAFALPLSTSVVSVTAALILVLWLIEGRWRNKWAVITSNPVALAVLGFLTLLCLGLLWSDNLIVGIQVIQDYWKIAMLPVLLTAINYRYQGLYITAFVAGISTAMLLTFLVWFDLLHYADVTPTHLTPKTFHVIYNPLLAFAAYLIFHAAIWGKLIQQYPVSRIVRVALFCLAGVMCLNMFLTEGRTGQLVFLVLLGLLLLQIFAQKRMLAILGICFLLPVIFLIGYRYSPIFQQRINMARQEIQGFRENPDTSVGMRLLFVQNSLQLISRHPWTGVGTGDFQASYAEVNQKRSPASIATDNPHNQYVLVAAMLGIPGFLLLLLIFAVMFIQAWKFGDDRQRICCAFPVFFLVIMLAESYLKVYETGFLFSLFSAVLFVCEPASSHAETLHSETQGGCLTDG
ncbi:MAG: O-antigen ligase domain-containing protein [Candidatus Electrothrix sp. AX1]|nr:O-antigen ligase domain-containing protein [Candidatus Electrothrix sp. AX1]